MFTKKNILLIFVIVLFFLFCTELTAFAVYNVDVNGPNGLPVPNFGVLNGENSLHVFIARYKNVATFIGGLATITMVGATLYNVGRLNLSLTNPMQRQQCIRGIIVCGIFAALLGSATLFIGLFYGLFR